MIRWPTSRSTWGFHPHLAAWTNVSRSDYLYAFDIYLLSINRLIFQIPQCIRQMSHNALFCNREKCSHMHVHIFHGYKIVHFGIWDWYIMGFVNKVNLDCTGAQGGAWFRIKRRQAAFHWQCQDSNLGVSVSRTHSDSPTHWMPVIIIKRLSYPGSN